MVSKIKKTNSEKLGSNPFFVKLLCGGLAGVVAKTAVAPFDRIKINFQVENPDYALYSGRINGVFIALRKMYSRLGFMGLFKGHSAMIMRIFPYAAINFTAYDFYKKKFCNNSGGYNIKWWQRVLSGSLAGATAVAATYPLDIIRVRMAVDINHNLENQGRLRGTLRELMKEGRYLYGFSVFGFYQGIIPTLLGIIPYAGLSFASFETLKMAYISHFNLDHLSINSKFIIGLVSGMVAQTAAYPLDVIRRRAQILRIAPHLKKIHGQDISMQNILRGIFRNSGWRGVFTGLSINYLKVAPATGISFVVYEFLTDILNAQ